MLATEFVSPEAFGGISWLQFSRIRPSHVNGVILAWLSMMYFGALFYMLPRLVRTRGLWSERLGVWTAWAWNLMFLLGVVGFCQALPRLLLGAVGGAIVDRVERRRLLLSTQISAMAQAFIFWALVYFETIQFWHVIVLVLFLGTVNTVNQTARHSLINNLVPREDLMNAIALNSSMANLAKIIGPSIGGVLISMIGVAGCLFVNAVSFLTIIATLVEQRMLEALDAASQLAQHCGHLVGKRTRGNDAILRAFQLRGRNHLHGLRDLPRVGYAADPTTDVENIRHWISALGR